MTATIPTPIDLVESVAGMRLPPKADALLTSLMDRNTNGQLSASEREQMESLVEVSEQMALVRAQALHLLGRKPA
jgi:hypothetical protein